MTAESLDRFITDVASFVRATQDEHQVTKLVAERLSACWRAATGFPRTSPDHRVSGT